MYWLSVRFRVWWLRFVTFRGDSQQKLVTWGTWLLLYLSKREMPYVSTVKDSRLNLDSVCLRSSLSSTVVLPTPSAQSFLLYTELRWQYQSLSVWSLMFPLYATMENWEKYSDSSSTSSSLMSLGGNKRNPLWTPLLISVKFSSVAQSCPTLCDPMNRSTPGLPVHHQLPEFTQTHVHWVGDPIQPSHPLSSPSPPALILSQHQVAKVLELQLQH